MTDRNDHLDDMLVLAHRAKEAVVLDFGVLAASRTCLKALVQCAKTAD